MTIIDEATAHIPPLPTHSCGISPRRPHAALPPISIDQHRRRVEISNAEYRADRTRLDFVTPPTPWETI